MRGARWPGDVLVLGGRVAAVGAVTRPPGARVLDATDCLVTPGLVNTHHHLFQRLGRGRGAGCDLVGWLRELLPWWARLSPDDMLAAARLALVELALGGVTTTVDHHFVVPASAGGTPAVDVFVGLADEAAGLGLRLVLARGVLDHGEGAGGVVPDALVEDPDEAMAAVDELCDVLARRHPAPADVTVAVAPSSLFAVSDRLLAAAAGLAGRRGLGLHCHLAESPAEESACRRRFGRRPAEVLEDAGWVRPGTWIAHGIHLPSADRQHLASAGVGVAHCPASNGRLASGVCPVAAWRASGAPVGLGTDGAAANDAGGMLDQLRLAVYLARATARQADVLGPMDVLAMATAEGARCLGRPDLGHLRPGAPADLAVWSLRDMADVPDPVDALVLGPSRRVRHLVVGGRPVVVEGELPGTDVARLRAEVAARGARVHAPFTGG